jgi:hypothetical protein
LPFIVVRVAQWSGRQQPVLLRVVSVDGRSHGICRSEGLGLRRIYPVSVSIKASR